MRDEAELTAFVVARGPALLRLAWLLTADADTAQDLVQEALARVVRRWDRVEPGAREAYVRAAVRSVWIDSWRRRRALVLVEEGLEGLEAGLGKGRQGSQDGPEVRLTLDDALRRLSNRQRTVLVLRFYEDLPERRVAELMGTAVGTVKSQTRHALDRLRVLVPDLAEAFDRSFPDRSAREATEPGTAEPGRRRHVEPAAGAEVNL